MNMFETLMEVVSVKQIVAERKLEYDVQVNSPNKAAAVAQQIIGDDAAESILVVVLDVKNRINAVHKTSMGTLDMSVVGVREIFRAAILNNGARIIVCHNHPSGDPTPSESDKITTDRLRDCGKILGIPLQDHIIATADSYYSFRENGAM